MSSYYATIEIDHDEQLEGVVRRNKQFYPASCKSRKRHLYQDSTIVQLIARKYRNSLESTKQRLLDDLFAKQEDVI